MTDESLCQADHDKTVSDRLRQPVQNFSEAQKARVIRSALRAIDEPQPARHTAGLWRWLLLPAAVAPVLLALFWLVWVPVDLSNPAPQAPFAPPIAVGEVGQLRGSLRLADSGGERVAAPGALVYNQSTLQTSADGLVELMLDRRFRLFAEADSRATLACSGTRVTIELETGSVILHADKRRPFEELSIVAGGVELLVRGTQVRVERRGRSVLIELRTGAVEIKPKTGEPSRMMAMQRLRLQSGNVFGQVEALSPTEAEHILDPFGAAQPLNPQPDSDPPAATHAIPSPPSTPTTPTTTNPPATDPYQEARALFFARRYQACIAVLDGWLDADQNDRPRARLLLGDAHRLDGSPERALVIYRRLADRSDSLGELALFETVMLHRGRDQVGAGLTTCEEYTRRFPHGLFAVEVALLQTELLVAAGHDDTALELLTARLQTSSDARLRLRAATLLLRTRGCEATRSELAAIREAELSAQERRTFEKLRQRCDTAVDLFLKDPDAPDSDAPDP